MVQGNHGAYLIEIVDVIHVLFVVIKLEIAEQQLEIGNKKLFTKNCTLIYSTSTCKMG